MASSTSGVGSEPFLISSYTTQRENIQVILELWGSQERIYKGIVKDLVGLQLSVISPASIFGGDDRSITGSALFTYIKTTKLSPVLKIQGQEEEVWLLSSADTDNEPVNVIRGNSSSEHALVDLEDEKALFHKLLPNNFLEVVKQHSGTEEDLYEFRTQLLSNGLQSYQNARFVDAIIWYTKALFVHKIIGDKTAVYICYKNLCETYFSLGNYHKAIDYNEKALQISKEAGNLSDSMDNNGSSENIRDDFAEEKASLQKILPVEFLEDIKQNYHAKEDLRDLGELLFENGNQVPYFSVAVAYFTKALFVYLLLGEKENVGACYGRLGVTYYDLKENHKAVNYFEKHLQIAQEVGDRKGEGDSYCNLGCIYLSLGEHQKAIQCHEKALQIAKDINDRVTESRVYHNICNVYRSLGDCRKAIQYYEKHLQVAHEIKTPFEHNLSKRGNSEDAIVNFENEMEFLIKVLPVDFSEEAQRNCSTNLGTQKFLNQLFENGSQAQMNSRFSDAITWFTKALFMEILFENKKNAGACFGRLGTVYNSLGEYRKAIEYHEKDLKIAQEFKDDETMHAPFCNLANVYLSLGNYSKAVQCYEKLLQITQKVEDRASVGIAYGNLGTTYFYIGDYSKAIQYLEKSLEIAKEEKDRVSEGKTYGNLGIAYQALGKSRIAIVYHKMHQKIAKEVGDREGEGKSYGNLGIAYRSIGEYLAAMEHHEKHLEIAKEIENLDDVGGAYGTLGTSYGALGNYQKATDYLNEHLRISKQIGNLLGEAEANYNLGNTFFLQQDFSKSSDALIQAIAIYDRIHANLERDEWKISIFESQSSAYRNLQRNYFLTGSVKRALEVCEKGRARSLFDIYCSRLQLSSDARKELDNITLEKMQAIAKREKTMFVYFSKSFDNDLHIWVVKEDRVHSIKVELPEGFKTEALPMFGREESARSLMNDYLPHRFLTLENLSAQSKEDEEQVDPNVSLSEGLEKCYQALITPIEEWLNGKRLTIITDATMRDVPFAALYKNGPNGREYLIDRFTISMAPSARIFDLIHRIKSRKDGSALIVADPAIKEDRLPGAKAEGQVLSQIIPNSKLLVDDAATVKAVKQVASEASILHFACHGLADALINKESVFEGALYLTNGQGEKEMLYADEIQKLDLKADLAFLSACHTGKGAKRREGVIGLSRAFLGAGVPSVIATNWSISDYTTQSMVSDFYNGILNKNMIKAEALREAMLIQRRVHPDNPYLWGAFFLIGK